MSVQLWMRILDHFSTSLTIAEWGILRDLLAFLNTGEEDTKNIVYGLATDNGGRQY